MDELSSLLPFGSGPGFGSETDRFKPSGSVVTDVSSWVVVDDLLKATADLIDPEYHKWAAKWYRQLGSETVYRIASLARLEARGDPKYLFSHLLKREIHQIQKGKNQ